MFYLLVIPGILQARPVRAEAIPAQIKEKVLASMPVDKSANQQEAHSTKDDVTLVALYEQFRRPIHSYTYRLLGSQEDADDVTQEVFVRAFTAWGDLYERARLSAWLYRIATNLCVDMLRRRKRVFWWSLTSRPRHEHGGAGGMSEDLSAFLYDSGGIPEIAERELIQLALAKLPAEYAVVLVLSAAQGVPYQEIASIVGISPNAAATRISRAKKMFAEQYQQLNKDGVGAREKKQ